MKTGNMFYNNIDPTLLKLGSFEIRYYGIIYAAGFVIAYFMIKYLAKERKLGLKKDDAADMLFYILAGVVLGARAFYVLIYDPWFYFANPLRILMVWHGGLSFHGGVFGGMVACYLFCKKKKIGFYEMLDICVVPLALGLALGRIGNFLNGELIGRITDVPWAVKFKGYDGFRHPSQIYESSKNFFIFFVLWFLCNKKLKKGFLFWLFIVMYSLLRFFIEFFREPDMQLGFIFLGLTMGQILNAIMFFAGAYFMIKLK